MIPVTPDVFAEGAQPIVLGANQPEYLPLPAVRDATGLVLTEWEFTASELAIILAGGRLRLWIHTFNQGFPPVSIEIVEAGS